MADDAIETEIELAAELRSLAEALTTREIGAERATAALELVRAIAPHLDGPPRERWYELPERPRYGTTSRGPFDTLSPVRGLLNPVAPPLDVSYGERDDGTRVAVGRVRLPRTYEGPPHGVHGGIVSALFDELLGAAQGLAPPPGVTARLEVSYRHLTPLEEDLRLEAWIVENRERRVVAHASCHAGDTLTATAKALFMRVDFKAVEGRMKARRG